MPCNISRTFILGGRPSVVVQSEWHANVGAALPARGKHVPDAARISATQQAGFETGLIGDHDDHSGVAAGSSAHAGSGMGSSVDGVSNRHDGHSLPEHPTRQVH